jgi:peroxiredoxin
MQGRWMYVALAVVLLLAGFFLYRKYRVAPEIEFANLRLSDLQGSSASLSSYEGKPLVLSFAASWCGPCINELSALRDASASIRPYANVLVVSDENSANIMRLRDMGNFPFDFLRLEGGFSSVGINSIPTTYLINAQGKVVKEKVGFIDWSDPGCREHMIKLLGS